MLRNHGLVDLGVPEHLAGGSYLAFVVQGQICGLDILRIREIVSIRRITPVQTATPHHRGQINLRGTAIPVIDLCRQPGPVPEEFPEETCGIIALASGKQLAILADRDIQQTIPENVCIADHFIAGVARIQDNPIILVEPCGLLSVPGMLLPSGGIEHCGGQP